MTDRGLALPFDESTARPRLVLWSLAGAFAWFALLWALSLRATGGAFEYPLDDVYIFLAIAGEIAAGGYGVNPGEPASAASSPLYPFLLAPFAGTDLARWVPLGINTLALGGVAWLWAALVGRAALAPAAAAGVAFLGPVALNFAGLATLGMEHGLHLAATLAVAIGLVDLVRGGRVTPLLVAGAILGPALRPEALAVSGVAALVLAGRRPWQGLLLGLAAIAPLAIFAGALWWGGIGPVPNSIAAKTRFPALDDLSALERRVTLVGMFLTKPMAKVLVVQAALLSVLALALRKGTGWLALAGAAVAAAHMVFGQIDWLNRYETYAVVFAAAMGLVASGALAPRLRSVLATLLLLQPAIHYVPDSLRRVPDSVAAVNAQQRQMARIAVCYDAPVAVNDLGWVAWASPHAVLDLWGLASPRALAARHDGAPRAWASRLLDRHDVDAALLYPQMADALPGDWTVIGTLWIDGPRGVVFGDEVRLYARPGTGERLSDAIGCVADDLPHNARLTRLSCSRGSRAGAWASCRSSG